MPSGASTLPPFTYCAPLPDFRRPLARLDVLLALLVTGISLAAYTATIGPTVTGEDAGELIVSAYKLGVAHPPGYPLWCLLGNLYTYIPVGSIAWRVGFMSACFGAAAVGLLFLFALKLGTSRISALLAALIFASTREFWEQANFAEVYTLNLVQIIGCMLLLWNWYEQRNDRYLYAFAMLYGLGLTNHNTMALFGPVFIVFVLAVEPCFWLRWRIYARCVLLALLMTSVYLYLPWASRAEPPTDWGNPETWSNFWAHVTRQQYKLGDVATPRSFGATMAQFVAFGRLYVDEFSPFLAWIPLVGAVLVIRRSRYAALLLGALAMTIGPGLVLILNFTVDRQSLWLNNVFWIPFYLVAAVLIAPALDWAGTARWRGTSMRPVVVLLGVIAIGLLAWKGFRANDKRNYWYADNFGRNCLATLEQDAIYFPSADHATFPALYLQAVEGLRPDVVIGNKYGYPEPSLYKDMPLEELGTVRLVPNALQEEAIENWVIRNTKRPVYFTKRRSMEALPGYTLVNTGLMYRVVRPGEEPAEREYWATYNWHSLDPEATRGELTADYVLADYYFFIGRDALAAGDRDEGIKQFDIVVRLSGDNKETFNNLGSAAAEFGFLQDAERYYKKTLEMDPEYKIALRNLAKVYLQQGDHRKALLQFEELLKRDGKDVEALRLSARSLRAIQWHEQAGKRLEYLASLFPGDASLYRELGELYRDDLKQPMRAHEFFSRSLELDPSQTDLLTTLSTPPPPGAELPGLLPEVPSPTAPTPTLPSIPELPSVPGANAALPETVVPQSPQPSLGPPPTSL